MIENEMDDVELEECLLALAYRLDCLDTCWWSYGSDVIRHTQPSTIRTTKSWINFWTDLDGPPLEGYGKTMQQAYDNLILGSTLTGDLNLSNFLEGASLVQYAQEPDNG